jgi:hypothetical protein
VVVVESFIYNQEKERRYCVDSVILENHFHDVLVSLYIRAFYRRH